MDQSGFEKMVPLPASVPSVGEPYSMISILLLLLMGSIFYILAQYYHLTFEEWSIWKGLAVVLPLVFMEYNFVLRANHMARLSGWSVVQIFMTIICLNFVVLLGFNKIFIGDTITWSDFLAVGMVAAAIGISYKEPPLQSAASASSSSSSSLET